LPLFLLFCLLTIKIKEGNCNEIAFGQCENGCVVNQINKRCVENTDCSQINGQSDITNYKTCVKKNLCMWYNNKCVNEQCAIYNKESCPKDNCVLINNMCVVKKIL
jgi:hypothetical protein